MIEAKANSIHIIGQISWLLPIMTTANTMPIHRRKDHLIKYLTTDFLTGGCANVDKAVCCVPTVRPIPTPRPPRRPTPTPVVVPCTSDIPDA